MSIWSHVAGIIRIDSFRFEEDPILVFDKLIGKECNWEDSEDVWDDATNNPNQFLPMGSEGSLHKEVYVNPNLEEITAYVITIFGDLRDSESSTEITEWFKTKCKEISEHYYIRQAVMTVNNDITGTETYVYEE